MLGILLIDKPLGCSSHDVVHQLRKRLGTRRVGHAGTLDPQATGLLVIAVGPATRFLQYLPLEPKLYRARVTFGVETNTYDSEGEVVSEKPAPSDLKERVEAAREGFMGLIKQVPPMYSAIKREGKPLYDYARRGETLEREARTIHIGRLDVEEVEGSTFTVLVECSGGTYIRSLAQDLGQAVGCGAYLSGLVRLKVGKFDLAEAVSLDTVNPAHLVPLRDALDPMPVVELSETDTEHIREGRQVPAPETTAAAVAVATNAGQVFGVTRVTPAGMLQPECVIPKEAILGSA